MDMVPQSEWGEEAEDRSVIHHNPWLEPKGEPLARIAADIFEEIEAVAVRQSARKPRKDAKERRRHAVGNLVASLAEIALRGGTESAIAINARKEARSRYDRRDLHRDVFLKAIAAMEHVGLLEVTPGKFRIVRTTMRPTAAFRDRLAAAGVTSADIGIRPGGEPIVLKANTEFHGHKEPVDYSETPETKRLREEVEVIVETLNRADLRLDGIPMPPVFLQRIFQIDGPMEPQVFNRHGRLWGGWWQSLKKERRHLITIDGQPICDLDFQACFLNLAYLRMGAPLPAGDPYALDGLDAGHRPALKKAFATLLFRDGGKKARLPAEIKRELPEGWTMQRLIGAFTAKHPAIAPLFGSGVGLEIMHTESRILMAALLDLARQGIPALGMHDGLALAADKKQIGIAAMRAASRLIAGVELPVIEKPLPKAESH